jgi:2-alkyl-3-oxoalkanoate reductase
VIFDDCDMEGGDESVPYPETYHAHYPRTKAMAERMIIAANSPELATVSLRPHMIWGPGDNHIIPGILARARSGRFRIVGGGVKVVDTVYVDNAALAHLQAADALAPGAPPAGRCYFITQGEPIRIIDMINGILDAAGVPRVTRTISPGAAYVAGALFEAVYRLFPLPGEPMITRFLALELSRAHWFSIEAARRDFGYTPVVTIEEGLRRLRDSFRTV